VAEIREMRELIESNENFVDFRRRFHFGPRLANGKHDKNIPKEAGLLKFLPVSGGRGRAVSLCDR
jgi:hypothetical protein